MSDEQASLDIVIRTRAETEGVEQLAGWMVRGIGAAERLGETLGGASGHESGEEAAPATITHGESRRTTEHETPGTAAPRPPGPRGPALPVSGPDAGQVDMPDMRAVELQVQAIVALGEQIRSALEQNGQTTLDVLHRILASIEHQNNKMAELDKELGQLAGRVKGLKNP